MDTPMKRYRIDVLTNNVPAIERLAGPYVASLVEADEAVDYRTYTDLVSRDEAETFWLLNDDELAAFYNARECSECGQPISPHAGLWGFEALQQRLLREAGGWNDRYQLEVFDSSVCQMRKFIHLMK